jgi:ethanolamine utilization protein EutA
VDGLDLRDLDYVDIGEVVRPAGVVPVVIKSLVFAAG